MCLVTGARALVTAWALAVVATAAPAQPASLRADGIPRLERIERAPAANDEPLTLRLVDWHPQRAEMLVLSRAGTSQQLHLMSGPHVRPRLLTRGRDAVEGARWEPEHGEYLVFRRDQGGDEAWRLYRLAGEGGNPIRISPASGRVSEYQFLPQGRGLVYLLETLDREDSEKARQAHSWLVWVDPLKPEDTRQLFESRGPRLFNLIITADGQVQVSRTVQRRTERLRWTALDREPQRFEAREGVPDDDEPSLWSSQAMKSDFRHLVRVGLRSGGRQPLLVDVGNELEAVAAPRNPGPLALVHNERGFSRLSLYDPRDAAKGLQPIAADLPPGVVRNLRWHPSQPWLAFEHTSAQNPGRLYVYDLATQTLRDWSGSAPRQAQAEYASLRWASFDGLEITALHIAPPATFDGPRPVMISLHGGPSSQARPGYLSPTHRLLVERLGMHLILPNVRGSTGFGERFIAADNGRQRENAVRDVSTLLDLIGTRADMDATRVVVEGGSYGGYLSLAVSVHESARIAGSICRVGIANFVTFLEQTESYRRDNRRQEYGDERDPAMREFLQRISPLTRAGDIKKPLFVVHGRNDPRVPYNEAEQMVRAVREQGTPVWFLTAEDEGHSFTQADNRDYLFDATIHFVRRVLNGLPMQGEAAAAAPR